MICEISIASELYMKMRLIFSKASGRIICKGWSRTRNLPYMHSLCILYRNGTTCLSSIEHPLRCIANPICMVTSGEICEHTVDVLELRHWFMDKKQRNNRTYSSRIIGTAAVGPSISPLHDSSMTLAKACHAKCGCMLLSWELITSGHPIPPDLNLHRLEPEKCASCRKSRMVACQSCMETPVVPSHRYDAVLIL